MPTQNSAHQEWYCRVFGMEFGPLRLETLHQMVQMGQLAADDVVRCGTNGRWQSVGQKADLSVFLNLKWNESSEKLPAAGPLWKAVELPEEWYYQVDDRTRGPLTLDAIRELIGTSGETASDVLVRRGADGPWMNCYSLPGISCLSGPVIQRESTRSAAATSPTASSTVPRNYMRTLRELVQDNREYAIAAVAWLLFNAIIIFVFLQSYATERAYYSTLRSLAAEAKALQARDASPQEWAALRACAKQTLAPIIQDLTKRASAAEPIRQHLLWAARDFPKLLGPPVKEMQEPERLFDRHMQLVDEDLEDLSRQ
jgi:hypothetical protein